MDINNKKAGLGQIASGYAVLWHNSSTGPQNCGIIHQLFRNLKHFNKNRISFIERFYA